MIGRRFGEELSVAAAARWLRCAVCGLFALASAGCSLLFSASSSDCGGKSCDACARDDSCCSSGWSLTDDFEGDSLSELRWVVLYGLDEAASVEGGSFLLQAPQDDVTVGISSRSALRLGGSSGRSVSIHIDPERPGRSSNVFLEGLSGTRYTFHLEQVISASGPTQGGDPIAYEDAPYLRFETDEDLMYWKTSADGESWDDAYHEPWVNEPMWLIFETYGQHEVTSDPLVVQGVNEKIDTAPPCSVALLHDDFEGSDAGSTVANRHPCQAIVDDRLVLADGCSVETALTYSLVEASVSVEVVSFDGDAEFAVLLADGSELSLEWNSDGVALRDDWILGEADQVPGRLRLRHHDGRLYGEHFVANKWEVVGSTEASTDLVSTVQVLLAAGWQGGGARFDDLSGSSP